MPLARQADSKPEIIPHRSADLSCEGFPVTDDRSPAHGEPGSEGPDAAGTAIIIAIIEELLFRGAIFGGATRPWIAIAHWITGA